MAPAAFPGIETHEVDRFLLPRSSRPRRVASCGRRTELIAREALDDVIKAAREGGTLPRAKGSAGL